METFRHCFFCRFLNENENNYKGGPFLKSLSQSPRAFFAFAFVLFFLVWIGLGTEVFARAGGGRTSGRTSTGAIRTYEKPPTQPSPAQQGDFQQQRTPSAPAPMTPSGCSPESPKIGFKKMKL
jgi:hypothetical protein